jgi:hypothetical protein
MSARNVYRSGGERRRVRRRLPLIALALSVLSHGATADYLVGQDPSNTFFTPTTGVDTTWLVTYLQGPDWIWAELQNPVGADAKEDWTIQITPGTLTVDVFKYRFENIPFAAIASAPQAGDIKCTFGPECTATESFSASGANWVEKHFTIAHPSGAPVIMTFQRSGFVSFPYDDVNLAGGNSYVLNFAFNGTELSVAARQRRVRAGRVRPRAAARGARRRVGGAPGLRAGHAVSLPVPPGGADSAPHPRSSFPARSPIRCLERRDRRRFRPPAVLYQDLRTPRPGDRAAHCLPRGA